MDKCVRLHSFHAYLRKQIARFMLFILLLFPLLFSPSSAAAAPRTSAGLYLIETDNDKIVLEIMTPSYSIIDSTNNGNPCQIFALDGAVQSAEVAAPQLPLLTELLGVPDVDISVTVERVESETLPMQAPPCPAKAAVVEEGSGDVLRYVEQEVIPNPAIYEEDVQYPAEPARLHDLGFMRSQRLAKIEVYPIQVNLFRREIVYHRRLLVTLHFAQSVPSFRGSTQEEEQSFEDLLSAQLFNYADAKRWRSRPVQAASSADSTPASWTPPENGYRIEIGETGLYQLTYSELKAAGFPIATANPDGLRMYYNGQEIAIRILDGGDGTFDKGDAILFYAEATTEKYTSTNVYWLASTVVSDRGAGGLRMSSRSGKATETQTLQNSTVAHYRATLHYEEDINYVSSLPMEADYDHWYGSRITAAGVGNRSHKEIPFQVEQLATGGDPAEIEIALAGNVRAEHHIRLLLNGEQIYEGRWEGRNYHEVAVEFASSILKNGENVLRIELLNDAEAQIFDMIFIDWAKMHYSRKLVAKEDLLTFASPAAGNWSYTVEGFSSNNIELYDVTTPNNVALIQGDVTNQQLAFVDNQPIAHRYFALSAAQRRTVASIAPATTTELRSPSGGADYIIIAHGDFIDAIQPLARFRARQGYNVRVIDVEDIYNQFNFGRQSPYAIHNFLANAYWQWPAPKPTYVLLVGDGNYDPKRHLETSAPTFIPAYLEVVDKDLGETATDNRYVSIAGNDKIPDMHIGRFPAKSVADVHAMVRKTMRYEQMAVKDDWNKNLLFVTDNLQGGGGAFYNYSDAIADGSTLIQSSEVSLLPEAYNRNKLYLGLDKCPDGSPALACQQEIVEQLNEGALFVSYVGHGAKQYWAEEQLLNLSALQRLDNADRLPIMLPMTCLEGFFHEADAGIDAFAESIVRMPDTGAVASWSPTGFGLVSGHDYLETGFFLAVFHHGIEKIGAAATEGKIHLLANAPSGKYDDLLDTFVLFGDPALRVRKIGSKPLKSSTEVYLPLVTDQ